MIKINRYNVCKNGDENLEFEKLDIEKTSNGLVNIIEGNRIQKCERNKFLQNILRDIEKKDNILLVDFCNDTFYVANIKFEKSDGIAVYNYIIEIEEYKLIGILKVDEFFIGEIKDIITYYQKFSEETLINISNKLGEVCEKEILESTVISMIKDYSKSKSIKNFADEELAFKIYSYIKSNMDFIADKMIVYTPHTTFLYKFISGLIDAGAFLCFVLIIVSAFGLVEISLSFAFLLLASFSGTLYLTNKSAKYRDANNYKILNEFLQALQYDFDITDNNEQKNNERECVLDDTKQRVLLEEKVKLRCEENIFGLNNASEKVEYSYGNIDKENEATTTYDGGPKLKFNL